MTLIKDMAPVETVEWPYTDEAVLYEQQFSGPVAEALCRVPAGHRAQVIAEARRRDPEAQRWVPTLYEIILVSGW